MGLTSAAGAITTDGDWSDWFTYGGNVGTNTWNENLVTLNTVDIRTQVDEEGPTPGGGGQHYDIEQIFYIYEDADLNALSGGVLHIGLVTGYPPEGRPADDLFAGDMFIDFGNTGDYSLAIATSTSAINQEVPGGVDSDYFGNNYFNDGTANWATRAPIYFSFSDPWRVERNPSIENLFTTSVAWNQVGVRYFLEVSVDIDAGLEDVLTNPQGGVGIHWTMECGNDVINVRDDQPLTPGPQLPVPEPSTFVLMGIGISAMALRSKFEA
jgi:hypothetical protein